MIFIYGPWIGWILYPHCKDSNYILKAGAIPGCAQGFLLDLIASLLPICDVRD